jgi:hypothetical protein
LASTTISIAANGDDGYVQKSAAAWAPNGSVTTNTTGIATQCNADLVTTTYTHRVILLRFDTSALPDTATITSAVLRVFSRADTWFDTDSRNLLGDYVSDWSAIDSTDYIEPETLTGSAFSADITSLGHANADIDITLTSPDANISKTAYTAFKIGVSGGTPTGRNGFGFAALDHATQTEPRLVIDYTESTVRMLASTGVGK